MSVDSFKELVTDKTTEDKIAIVLSEYEYEKYTTLRVPTTITIPQMKDLLTLSESLERKKWFSYLYARQMARNKSNEERKRRSDDYWTKKRTEYEERKGKRTGLWDENNQLEYGLWHNSPFSKVVKNSINQYYKHRLRTAALFGPKLVIDLDYDPYMKLSECRQLGQQIHLLYNWNRYRAKEPFDLHFTNCDPKGPTIEAVHKYLPNHKTSGFSADFHQKSYTDLFAKERLVYLSPHSNQTLKTMNCDDIHIIGGLLDKSFHEPLSYVKAKKEGIRCVRLPIEEYIVWSSGTKSLCLNHIIQILHDFNLTANWSQALKDNIPKRKQKSAEQIEYEDMLRKQKLNRFKKDTKFDPRKANNYF